MRLLGMGFVAAVALAAPANYAKAQLIQAGPEAPEASTPERQSVLQRPRPDYDPLGVRAGSFLIVPTLDVQEAYDSNVYATTNNTKSDWVTSVLPGVAITSDWNNNALNFTASGDIKRYSEQVSENNSDAGAFLNGRFDIERDVYFVGGLSYQLLHEDRTSPDTVANQKNPTEYQLASARFGYVHEPGRLGARLDGSVDWLSYNNAETSTGTTIIESDRNHAVYTVTPRVQYEIAPGYHAFIKVPFNDRQYESKRDSTGFDRNSKGYEVDAGTALDLGHALTGELYVGYLDQRYDDSRLKTVSGANFGGNILWNVTPLTSLRLAVLRTVEETTLSPASSYLQTVVSPSIEHELMPNLLLSGGFSYITQDFQGISRTDDIYETDAGVRYLINRNCSVGLNGTYRWRRSNAPLTDFDQDIVIAKLRIQI